MAESKKKKIESPAKQHGGSLPVRQAGASGGKKPKVRAAADKVARTKASRQKIKVAVPEPKATHKSDGTLPIFDLKGKTLETLTLDPMFHEGAVNTDVIFQAVVKYQAGKREGTAATKTRGEVSGGGKKPWKQKHTGRARHASIRSPLWRGGGVTFGPHPRDYSYSIPLQIRRKAVAEGVKDKVAQGKLILISSLEFDSPKTKQMLSVMQTFKLEKPLILVDEKKVNVLLSSRNIAVMDVKSSEEVNALDVVSHKECLMTKAAYSGLLKRLKS